jgi:hypothetical protein
MTRMVRNKLFLVLFLCWGFALSARAESPLPPVGQVDSVQLRNHCKQLLETLDKLKAPLSADTARELKALLMKDPGEGAEFAGQVQELLDPLCLIGVSINPESRVKALRGTGSAELRLDKESVVLLKLVNEGGVTHALTVSGPQVRSATESSAERWLEATVLAAASGKGVTGNRLEYLLLRLTPHEGGKREATLRFDVGQGTQDLGFRAEVPVLFNIKRADK